MKNLLIVITLAMLTIVSNNSLALLYEGKTHRSTIDLEKDVNQINAFHKELAVKAQAKNPEDLKSFKTTTERWNYLKEKWENLSKQLEKTEADVSQKIKNALKKTEIEFNKLKAKVNK